MTQLFSTLDRLTIKPAADGLVAVTVLLPPELVRDYCRFLESLADSSTPSTVKPRLSLLATALQLRPPSMRTDNVALPSTAHASSIPSMPTRLVD